MGRGLPVGPMVSTVVAVAAANVVLAYLLAGALSRGPVLELGAVTVGGLVLVALGAAAASIGGWKQYLRRRRGS